MVICNEIDEAEEVAKYLGSKKIPHQLMKEIDSDCKRHFTH